MARESAGVYRWLKKMADKKISYGQKFLLNLMDLRELARFHQVHLSDFSFAYVYNVAVGKFDFPSVKFIHAIMNIIPPDRWFFYVGEDFDYMTAEDADYVQDYRQSANYRTLQEIPKKHGSYRTWCQAHGFSYRSFMSIINGNRQLTPQRIFQLRSIFPPHGWFVRSGVDKNE